MIKKLTQFAQEDIWLLSEQEFGQLKGVAMKYFKILLLSIKGFGQNSGELRASALTLYTLLSIVPVIAMLFGIAKGFGFEKNLQQQLLLQIPKQETTIIRLIEFAQNMLVSTQGGVVAGMGVMMLFWTVIKVIGTIEDAFNQIWHIEKGRTLARKLSDYLSLMLLAPILLIAASSMTVFVKTQLHWLIDTLQIPNAGHALLLTSLNVLPVVIMAGLFSFIFIFLPNQKIQLKAGMMAGIVTGILYQIIQAAYVSLQIGVTSYNAIYGSFAALPLFLVWLQLGWLIVLFGCEISFFIQHYETYKHDEKFSDLSLALQKVLALQLAHAVVQRFAKAEKALTAEELAALFSLPIAVVQMLLARLVRGNILVEIKPDLDERVCFQPAQHIDLLTIYVVVASLEHQGVTAVPQMALFEKMLQIHKSFAEKFKNSPENRLLKDL